MDKRVHPIHAHPAWLSHGALLGVIGHIHIRETADGFRHAGGYDGFHIPIIRCMPASKSGVANAVFYAAGDLGVVIGATLWGVISNLSSYGTMFVMASVAVLVGVLLAVIQLKVYAGQEAISQDK